MFKKLWKFLLVILIVVVAFYFPAIMTSITTWFSGLTGWAVSPALMTAIASAPWWVGLAAGVGLSYLIDPETTTEVVKDVAGAAGDLAGAVVDGITSSVNWLVIAGLALGAWFLVKSGDDKPTINSDPQGEPT